MTDDERQTQPSRMLVGFCPAHDCDRIIAVTNHGETWPLLTCACGWHGGTNALDQWALYARGAQHPVMA